MSYNWLESINFVSFPSNDSQQGYTTAHPPQKSTICDNRYMTVSCMLKLPRQSYRYTTGCSIIIPKTVSEVSISLYPIYYNLVKWARIVKVCLIYNHYKLPSALAPDTSKQICDTVNCNSLWGEGWVRTCNNIKETTIPLLHNHLFQTLDHQIFWYHAYISLQPAGEDWVRQKKHTQHKTIH